MTTTLPQWMRGVAHTDPRQIVHLGRIILSTGHAFATCRTDDMSDCENSRAKRYFDDFDRLSSAGIHVRRSAMAAWTQALLEQCREWQSWKDEPSDPDGEDYPEPPHPDLCVISGEQFVTANLARILAVLPAEELRILVTRQGHGPCLWMRWGTDGEGAVLMGARPSPLLYPSWEDSEYNQTDTTEPKKEQTP